MKADALAMLGPHDWALLQENMRPVAFRRGAVILQEGVPRRALMIIRTGAVRVERLIQDRAIVLAQLGPDEVLGEIGFVENNPPIASVIAEEDCTVDLIEGDALQSLIATESAFATRFYHSLAIALARRVRSNNHARSLAAGLGGRSQQPRTGNLSAQQIPAGIRDGLEEFERVMLASRIALRAGGPSASAGPDGEGVHVAAACDRLLQLLQTFSGDQSLVEIGYTDLLSFRDPEVIGAGIGDLVFRETFSTFMLSATMSRCYRKPRGFPDDFETMAMMRRAEPEGDDRLGPLIDRWFLDRPLCRSRRDATGTLRTIVAESRAAHAAGDVLRVASLASGAAPELFDFFAVHPTADIVATCVDVDDHALIAGARRADSVGLGERVSFLKGDVVPMDGTGVALLTQDLIYALGLCEYLSDDQVVALLDMAWAVLAPGGRCVLTQLADGNPDRDVMRHLLDWQATHRSAEALRRLIARSRFAAAPVEVILDRWQVAWLVSLEKAT